MVQAKKALGQHFLTDQNYCRKIVRYAGVGRGDVVVEIGPGTGQLTAALLEAGAHVTAIEFDSDMIAALRDRFPRPGGDLDVVSADILAFDWSSLPSGRPLVKLVGNLPYNISTRILKQSAEAKDRFESFTFMVQKEVAERVIASPGSKAYGYFSVLMEYHFERRRGFDVPPGAFQPRPRVMSHVMRLEPKRPDFEVPDYGRFERLLAGAFAHRRKTLWNNLVAQGTPPSRLTEALCGAGLDPKTRAERVTLEQFVCLARLLV
jgi:16S rRNA (adenine1518-N6/adenine1519-N6)-dimethyltransferase